MDILNKLGIVTNPTRPFVASVGSSAGIGKTSMLIIIANELVNEGKNVLFISEDSAPNILRKSVEFNKNKNKTKGKFVVVGKFFHVKRLEYLIEGRDFDYIFLDSYVFNDKENISSSVNIIKSKNISIFVSVQLNRVIEPVTTCNCATTAMLQYTDYVYVLTKKEKLTFWEKVKYWIKFANVPNFNLNLVKNRHGKNKRIDFYIKFNDINK